MTELDLARIKTAAADLDDETIPDSTWTQRAIRLAAQVPRMIAELERQQRLLDDTEVPSVDGYESMAQALADERAANGRAHSLLQEILSYFYESGHPGYAAIRTGWIREETVLRWRSAAGGSS